MVKYVSGIAVLAVWGCMDGSSNVPPDAPDVGFSGSGGSVASGFGGGNVGKASGGTSALPIPPSVGGEGEFSGQPELPGPVFTADRPPKPVSGGTILVMADEKTAIVSDPDGDQVFVVDLEAAAITSTIELDADAEPGRAAEDGEGQVHVVLRGSGKLLTLAPATGEVLATRAVCKYPRGIAVARDEKLVHVACAEGSLVTLSTDATQAEPVRTLSLPRDLRDVVTAPDGLWVSRFRSAEILRLDAEGTLVSVTTPPSAKNGKDESTASVAWRMVPTADGGVAVVHQRAFVGEVTPSPGGYAESGSGAPIVDTAVTLLSASGVATSSSGSIAAPLPVDLALSPVNGNILVASATIEHPSLVGLGSRAQLLNPSSLQFTATPSSGFVFQTGELAASNAPGKQLIAVAFMGETPVLQYREPNVLIIGDLGVGLPSKTTQDTGNTLFHLQTGSQLACASCHPEGQEDGHVWHFSGFGPRRTQSLRGGLLGSEPFHWDGAEQDFAALTSDVMQGRMAGPPLTDEQNTALAKYIDGFRALPAPTPAASDTVVERGKTLFNDAEVGCATCHGGKRFSNDQTMFVGGDAPLQVPSLVGVWARAPYLHDGCAQTLLDRFTTCDTGEHGNLKGLSGDDLNALVAYLDSL